jgi:hypothetical protein
LPCSTRRICTPEPELELLDDVDGVEVVVGTGVEV